MFESKSGVFFVAGVFFFAFAFLSNAVVPALMYRDLPVKTVAELVNPNVRYQFEDLAQRYPEQFKKYVGDSDKEIGTAPVRTLDDGSTHELLLLPIEQLTDEETRQRNEYLAKLDAFYNEKCAEMMELGRDVYVAEACWHCHSQFVRPVSNESTRWGPVSESEEYQNELQRPVLFGTRRVGPDLIREGGRRSSDWHAVHFFRPTDLSEGSPMPPYPWFFDGSADKPNKRGLALITYIQWLGSWLDSYPYYEQYDESPIAKLQRLQKEQQTEAATQADDESENSND